MSEDERRQGIWDCCLAIGTIAVVMMLLLDAISVPPMNLIVGANVGLIISRIALPPQRMLP